MYTEFMFPLLFLLSVFLEGCGEGAGDPYGVQPGGNPAEDRAVQLSHQRLPENDAGKNLMMGYKTHHLRHNLFSNEAGMMCKT